MATVTFHLTREQVILACGEYAKMRWRQLTNGFEVEEVKFLIEDNRLVGADVDFGEQPNASQR